MSTFCAVIDIPSTLKTFHVAEIHSVNFCEISVWPGDRLTTFYSLPCSQKTFRHLSVQPGDLS